MVRRSARFHGTHSRSGKQPRVLSSDRGRTASLSSVSWAPAVTKTMPLFILPSILPSVSCQFRTSLPSARTDCVICKATLVRRRSSTPLPVDAMPEADTISVRKSCLCAPYVSCRTFRYAEHADWTGRTVILSPSLTRTACSSTSITSSIASSSRRARLP